MKALRILLVLAAAYAPLIPMSEAKKWQKVFSWVILILINSLLGPEVLSSTPPKLWIIGLTLCCSLIWTLYVSLDNAGPPTAMLIEGDDEHFSSSRQRDEDETGKIDWNARCASCHLSYECKGPVNDACQLHP